MYSQFTEKSLSHSLRWYDKFSPVWIMRCILSLPKNLCHIRYIDMVNFHQYEPWDVFSVYRKSFVTLATFWYGFSFIKILFSIVLTKKRDKRLATLATLIRFLSCAALNDTNNDIVFEIFSYDCSHKMSTECTW